MDTVHLLLGGLGLDATIKYTLDLAPHHITGTRCVHRLVNALPRIYMIREILMLRPWVNDGCNDMHIEDEAAL